MYDIRPPFKNKEEKEEVDRIIDLRKDLRKMSDDELYEIINKEINER